MRVKHALLSLILAFLSCIVLTVGSLLYMQRVVMVDFEVVSYGFPFPCVERVLCTFAGRTDFLIFETSNLVKDIVLYLLPSLGFWFTILLLKQKRTFNTKVER